MKCEIQRNYCLTGLGTLFDVGPCQRGIAVVNPPCAPPSHSSVLAYAYFHRFPRWQGRGGLRVSIRLQRPQLYLLATDMVVIAAHAPCLGGEVSLSLSLLHSGSHAPSRFHISTVKQTRTPFCVQWSTESDFREAAPACVWHVRIFLCCRCRVSV